MALTLSSCVRRHSQANTIGNVPADDFTEPDPDVDTLANPGPLIGMPMPVDNRPRSVAGNMHGDPAQFVRSGW